MFQARQIYLFKTDTTFFNLQTIQNFSFGKTLIFCSYLVAYLMKKQLRKFIVHLKKKLIKSTKLLPFLILRTMYLLLVILTSRLSVTQWGYRIQQALRNQCLLYNGISQTFTSVETFFIFFTLKISLKANFSTVFFTERYISNISEV